MASGGKSRPGPSKNLFESVQVESDAAGDQVDYDGAIDIEEDDADQYNEAEMSDEDEFIPFSDDSDIVLQLVIVIVKYTTEEGKRQRGDAWKATDNVEIRGLIGILVFLGAQKQSKVNLTTIWEPLIGQDFARATMSKTDVSRC
ncbi:hypothetical protein PoB_005248700 [Plakobranchus ocellatus]|uniref:PiggyBac transposable element-derived protein domain-containing protein n=1 Tax=Plakobranchus ocellatus TaxID=259542 RepID=A0AAV4C3Z0_9GAST|nr:hypothetical protein PoB_005248700 [Plakobranchus ocellatus]